MLNVDELGPNSHYNLQFSKSYGLEIKWWNGNYLKLIQTPYPDKHK